MPNESWMAAFTDRDDLTLCDITWPASHDAGLSESPNCYIPYTKLSVRDSTICHYSNIAGQLNAGSRAFDLRFGKLNGVVRAIHGEGIIGGNFGGYGQDAISMFKNIDTFLQQNTGEIVIIRVSHTKEDVGVHNLIAANIHADRRLRVGPRNIAAGPLSALRGKAIAIFDEKALAKVDPINGTHRLIKYEPGKTPAGGLPICGKYAGQLAGLKAMVKEGITCGNKHGTEHPLGRAGGKKHDHIFMVYWQLANDVKNKTTKGQDERNTNLMKIEDSKGTHYNLDYLFNSHRGTFSMTACDGAKSKATRHDRLKYRPNWVNLDFVNDISCGKVIEFNNELLPPRP